MSLSEKHFKHLMQQVKEGSDDAVQELLDLCNRQVYRIVRRNLSRKLRSQFDSGDFVQAMWASFFDNLSVISKFDRPENLVAFLGRVARNKVIDEGRRRLKSQKRNVQSQVSIERHSNQDSQPTAVQSLETKEPTPSETAIANEEWSRLLNGQTSRHQQILRLRAAGKKCTEIAKELGLHERTVRRVIEKLIGRLARS